MPQARDSRIPLNPVYAARRRNREDRPAPEAQDARAQLREAAFAGWDAIGVPRGLAVAGIILVGLLMLAGLFSPHGPRQPRPDVPARPAPQATVAPQPVATTGRLRVLTHPWSRVEVDGQPVGNAPMRDPVELPVGRHRVRLTPRAFPEVTLEVMIRPGELTELHRRFPSP